ncbi:hypothetical protein M1247_16900 [Mycobacterium sp. 21AC1]|uniref:hypothetical protein n=1 Tax=[Mycobacterium] appelbergii TaxID=2939269 RepID=UPI002939491C|nr:hypothetical protein [Mycobacterium sp. 21AC1]MDV3126604.1 hypothetical protein [Mycobacterium sp. 21AC1]
MNNLVTSAIALSTLAVASLSLAEHANAAPTGPQTPDQVISQLHSQGYQVIVNKLGAAPLEQCQVSAVRPGQTYARTDSGVPGAGSSLITTVTGMTVYVDIKC